MNNIILNIENARKSFGKNTVLKDVSLNIEKGSVTAILGPSGSGKSTLLRCLTLLDRFDGGSMNYYDTSVCVDNEKGMSVYNDEATLKKARSYFSLVFQNYNLFPHYSVLKNLVDPQVKVLGKSEKEAQKVAEKLLGDFGLIDKKDSVPCDLSGGQKQRVAITRALAMNPDILFFDEPTSALDPELVKDILEIIRKLAKENMTLVIVTHEINFAKEVADNVIFMENGFIVEQGSPDEVLNNPKEQRTKEFLGLMK